MNRDHALLIIINNYIERIESYVEGYTIGEFCNDLKTYDASCMMLQQIGEISSKLSEGICLDRFPIEQMKGLRNRMAHDYIGVDDRVIWNIIQISIPELKEIIEKLLKSF